ncbi:RrF2 family transcriptional regulator [Lignipirellula cremea]|uniref:HTH-type transcriptional regulator CymR n=1 Tax=Lignipirellula cremea TaxID=2528010 RepID=A0A518DV64_9BACT|nr:Rrf2 family transcriptional regulator [Lignipirellula cremea]QDU95723.1 HTH-type transcriptional regulator CymR [Lignipirellula cremea]
MHISAKTEYACLAILELAARYDDPEPATLRSIAERHGAPSRFLVQILLQLKSAGLVASTRGAAGGYRLSRAPAKISLGEVMAAVDGSGAEVTSNTEVDSPISRTLMRAWTEVHEMERAALAAISFADLAEEARGEAANMYYI